MREELEAIAGENKRQLGEKRVAKLKSGTSCVIRIYGNTR